MITKTDFLLFLDSPMHLWASKHGELEIGPSPMDQHRMLKGKEIEALARQFIQEHHLSGSGAVLEHETTITDGNFQARADTIARYPDENFIDIYEIKSSNSIDKQDRYDVAFQRIVYEACEIVRNIFIVHLNKEYVLQGALDLDELFIIELMNEEIEKLRLEVITRREEAYQIAAQEPRGGIIACYKPDECPCFTLCHGELPEHSIYDIPRLSRSKKNDLRTQGVLIIQDLPVGYPLSDHQSRCVEAVKAGEPLINIPSIKDEIDKLEYPLYFLDYESYNPGIPMFDGYRPYQYIVFQYSLHVVDAPERESLHHELLITDDGDPGLRLVEHLSDRIGPTGSVIVWHKTFEMGRNREMADLYREHGGFLLNINDRIYDLKEIFSKGFYVHPGSHGSASIKKVLPVLVPEFERHYESMAISDGEEAMLVWERILSGSVPSEQVPQLRREMLSYCKLDTLAMVEIWKALKRIIS